MVNPIFARAGTSIFEAMSRLAGEAGSINLGQGFPEGMEPAFLIDAAVKALQEGPHQYPPMMGLPALRQAVAENTKRFLDIDVDWEREVLVTSGATEALADTFLALLEAGDEVLVFEPVYDVYAMLIRRAGAIPVPVRLVPPHWDLPREQITSLLTSRTRTIVINTPMNPIGKIFDDEELVYLSGLVLKHDLVVIAGEVYEHLTFDGRAHKTPFALTDIRDRVIRIGSAGKTFSVTGWKVGYVTADTKLLAPIARAHQFVTFTTPPALQAAVAVGLRLPDAYFQSLKTDLDLRRDVLLDGLCTAGFTVADAASTSFAIADISGFDTNSDDLAFSQRLTLEARVTPVPISSFYGARDVTSHVRFCFAKKIETLEEAVKRLGRWREDQSLQRNRKEAS